MGDWRVVSVLAIVVARVGAFGRWGEDGFRRLMDFDAKVVVKRGGEEMIFNGFCFFSRAPELVRVCEDAGLV